MPILKVAFINFRKNLEACDYYKAVLFLASVLAILASTYSYLHGYTTAYGDAESHLNIAKRVTDSLTPGFAQLGGIWLPLPHLLLLPFVAVDFLWRTGLAGSIVNGLAFVASAGLLFKITKLLTRNNLASFVASFVFVINPNILYLQSTPMTELTLIMFVLASSLFFLRFLQNHNDLTSLIYAGIFSFASAMSRYDGWFLICIQLSILLALYLPFSLKSLRWLHLKNHLKSNAHELLLGRVILFGSIAVFAIVLWLGWDWLILGDPLYFLHSPYSAGSQQDNWRALGELPAYHNIWLSVVYYSVTAYFNIGPILTILSLIGIATFLYTKPTRKRFLVLLLLLTPFFFYVVTLFLGQSVIFIPELTPTNFRWNLFNVRYGAMTIPLASIFLGYLFLKIPKYGKIAIICLILLQTGLFANKSLKIITLEDGKVGLSSAINKQTSAQDWLAQNYNNEIVLLDDYARTISIIRAGLPLDKVIYIGNKPYWPESLEAPEKYAELIIMQRGDAVWQALYENPDMQGRLYKYFAKAYTSPDTLIFKRSNGQILGSSISTDTTRPIRGLPKKPLQIRGPEKTAGSIVFRK